LFFLNQKKKRVKKYSKPYTKKRVDMKTKQLLDSAEISFIKANEIEYPKGEGTKLSRK